MEVFLFSKDGKKNKATNKRSYNGPATDFDGISLFLNHAVHNFAIIP